MQTKKKIFNFVFMSVMALFMAISFCSCEEQQKDCEENNYGKVIVKNNTSTRIVVDVTEGSSEYNNERWVSIGNSTTYNKVNAGNITIWASRSGDQHTWYKDSYNLSACEEYTYTWYDATGDSGNDEVAMTLEFSMYGKLMENPVILKSTVSKNQ